MAILGVVRREQSRESMTAAGPQTDREREGVFNRLLLAMPDAVFSRIGSTMRFVNLPKGQSIHQINERTEHVYFVNRGMAAAIKQMQDGRSVEIIAVGNEGVTDPLAIFGVRTSVLETVVQIPGSAWRVPSNVLAREIERDDGARHLMSSYLRFALSQVSQVAACNRLHHLRERCCRWLLHAQDSALSDVFPVTHEFLAQMLGAQRAHVSISLSALQSLGLIKLSRGHVAIVDRARLQNAACECYEAIRLELAEALRPNQNAAHAAPVFTLARRPPQPH